MGGMTAPVARSGSCPAWIARVANLHPGFRSRSATVGASVGDLSRAAIHRSRLFDHRPAIVHDPELVVGAIIFGIESDGPLESLDRLVELVELIETDADMVVSAREVGVEIQRATKLLDGSVASTALGEDDPHLAMRLGVARIAPQHSLEYRLRLA